jgi:uncharacterized membrane protein
MLLSVKYPIKSTFLPFYQYIQLGFNSFKLFGFTKSLISIINLFCALSAYLLFRCSSDSSSFRRYCYNSIRFLLIYLFSWILLVCKLLNAMVRNKVDFHILQNNTEILCQRCAKSTRSVTLYPLCCDKKETVRAWCETYLNFGLHIWDMWQ